MKEEAEGRGAGIGVYVGMYPDIVLWSRIPSNGGAILKMKREGTALKWVQQEGRENKQ